MESGQNSEHSQVADIENCVHVGLHLYNISTLLQTTTAGKLVQASLFQLFTKQLLASLFK